MNKSLRQAVKQKLWEIYSGHYKKDKTGQVHQWAQCFYCGAAKVLSALTIDHVIPTSKGGDDNIHNLLLSCRLCNSEKADRVGMGWQWSGGRKKK